MVPRLITPAVKRQGPTPGTESAPLRGWAQGPDTSGEAAGEREPSALSSAALERPAVPSVLPDVPPDVADDADLGPVLPNVPLERPAWAAEREIPEALRERGPPLRQGRGGLGGGEDPGEDQVRAPGWTRPSREQDTGRIGQGDAMTPQERDRQGLDGGSGRSARPRGEQAKRVRDPEPRRQDAARTKGQESVVGPPVRDPVSRDPMSEPLRERELEASPQPQWRGPAQGKERVEYSALERDVIRLARGAGYRPGTRRTFTASAIVMGECGIVCEIKGLIWGGQAVNACYLLWKKGR